MYFEKLKQFFLFVLTLIATHFIRQLHQRISFITILKFAIISSILMIKETAFIGCEMWEAYYF